MRVSMAANKDLYKKLKEESSMVDVFEDIFHDELTAKWNDGLRIGEARGEERARRSIMENLIAGGMSPDKAAATTGLMNIWRNTNA